MKNKVYCGIDGLTCSIPQNLIQCEMKYPFDSRDYFLKLTPKLNSTEIAIVLPRTIRETNEIPFEISDLKSLDDAIQTLSRALRKSTHKDFTDVNVKQIEVGITVDLKEIKEKTAENIMTLLSRVFLVNSKKGTKKNNAIVSKAQDKYVIGKPKNECFYIKDEITVSFETQLLSNRRFKIKAYNRGSNTEFGGETSIIRIEFLYVKKGIEHILKNKDYNWYTLQDILTHNIIRKSIQQFRSDYDAIVQPTIYEWINEATSLIYNSLKSKKTYEALLYNKDILYDFNIYREALRTHYKETGRSADAYRKMISYVKKQMKKDKIFIPEDLICIFSDIEQSIKP